MTDSKKNAVSKAVVFVLDASPSMNTPFPCTHSLDTSSTIKVARTAPSKSTRLRAAKHAVIHGLAELMKSTKNEANVIVCKTRETTNKSLSAGGDDDHDETDQVMAERDEENDSEDDNDTERKDGNNSDTDDEIKSDDSSGGSNKVDGRHLTHLQYHMSEVTEKLLHQVNNVQTQLTIGTVDQVKGGTILHGLFYAQQDLSCRKPNAKHAPAPEIVIVTDAQHNIVWAKENHAILAQMVRELEEMKCPVHLILVGVPDDNDDGDGDEPSSNESTTSDDECDTRSKDSDNGKDYQLRTLAHRVSFLRGIIEQTGGGVASALTPQAVYEAVETIIMGRNRITKAATKSKVELVILPDLVVNARRLTLLVKKNLPTVKTDSFFLTDDKGNDLLDQDGKPRTDKAYKETFYTDGEDVVDVEDVAKAVKYGNDFVMMSAWDYQSLSSEDNPDKPRYEILGFLEESRVPMAYLMGPPYAIVGEDKDVESQAMVAALAQALHQLKEVGVCIVRTKERPGTLALPVLGALYPFKEPPQSSSTKETVPTKLLFLRLPFEGEVKDLQLGSLQEDDDSRQVKACEDLVNAMMLPPGVLDSGTVFNPMIRSWDQTLVQRVLDPTADVVSVRSPDQNDPMKIPMDILEKAKPALDYFWQTFNLPATKPNTGAEDDKKKGKGKKEGKNAHYYKDFL